MAGGFSSLFEVGVIALELKLHRHVPMIAIIASQQKESSIVAEALSSWEQRIEGGLAG